MPTTGFGFLPTPEVVNHADREQSCRTPGHGRCRQCIADKGCTVCIDVCPLDALQINPANGKAHMRYDECWYCMPCAIDCPTKAVTVSIPYLLR